MPNILDIISRPIRTTATKSAVDVVSQPIKKASDYWIRNNKISEADLEESKAILFGEISNRPPEKQKLEAQTILNTAFNRIEEYGKRGMKKTLTEVLQMPNQYQAYMGKQYKKFKSGFTEELDNPKIDSINSVIDEVKSGTFQNNIGASVFYSHKPDGRIIATNNKLFK